MKINVKACFLFLLLPTFLGSVFPRITSARRTNLLNDPAVSEGSTPAAEGVLSQQSVRTAVDGWVPPETNTVYASVAPEATCSLHDVLSRVGAKVDEFYDNINRVTATEFIRHQTVGRFGALRRPEVLRSDYLGLVERAPNGSMSLAEYHGRNADPAPQYFSDGVAVQRTVALISIFHPNYVHNFQMVCEGLGAWRGQPAWQIRFEERSDSATHLSNLRIGSRTYHVKLRGRAWILADSYDVGQLETDLEESIPEVRLRLRHEVSDFSPVSFPGSDVTMWLPSSVDLYVDFRDHRFRQLTSYSDFALFSVKVDQQFGYVR